MFRILSIDGGGVRGYLPATILANLESYLNRVRGEDLPLGARFDLIAGTSTGGIIALGLAHGVHARVLANFYETEAANVFSKSLRARWPRKWLRPSYPAAPLRAALTKVFPKEATLADLKADVCIPAVSLTNAKPRLYKTDYFDRNVERLQETLVDVALATAAAPTFFPAHSTKYSSNLIDGGVCANNPSMIAVVDALQFQRPSKRGTGVPRNLAEIALLSMGTGESCAMPYDYQKLINGGEWHWARPFFQVAIESQSELIHFQAKFLLQNYLRINPPLKFVMKLDEYEKLPDLKNLCDITEELERFARTHL